MITSAIIICISLWIGWVARDRYICGQISIASDKGIGNSLYLSGDSLNHIRCLSILSVDDLEAVVCNIPIDPTISMYIRRVIYHILGTMYKRE